VKTRKTLIAIAAGMLVCMAFASLAFAYPSVFPTGTTIYNPDRCWNGYTLLCNSSYSPHGIILIDMNGNVVHRWMDVVGFPAKLLPGGQLLAQDRTKSTVVQVDWNGNIVNRWKMLTPGTRQHHDVQREGNPVGYYTPALDFVEKGTTLILGRTKPLDVKKIKWPKGPQDPTNRITEVSWDGKVVWDWKQIDHKDEVKTGVINCASWLGPNKWYDAGDERFYPGNVIFDNTFGDSIIIISRKTGEVVWRVGPDYSEAPQLAKLGYIKEAYYGRFQGGMLHHAHMIPRGLPGEGNILVFNNGCPYSLVTEFNPITLEVVWEYSGLAIGYGPSHSLAHSFFSATVSSAQRLPNGNTLICEGDDGRIFEVTRDLEIVWEYVNPYLWKTISGTKPTNGVYRAYRVPYDWVPQLEKPVEQPIVPPSNAEFRVEPEAMKTMGY